MSETTLADAEFELEFDLPNWPTHALDRICGNLVNIGPLLLPTGVSRVAYGILWRSLDMRDATDLLKYLAGQELGKRDVEQYDGPCPACGKSGVIKKFDKGFYYIIKHPNATPASLIDMKLPRLSSTCYHGPHPVPKRNHDERNTADYRRFLVDGSKLPIGSEATKDGRKTGGGGAQIALL